MIDYIRSLSGRRMTILALEPERENRCVGEATRSKSSPSRLWIIFAPENFNMNQPHSSNPQVIIVMGVSGCGKSTLGQRLANRIDAVFRDGDDFHPQSNKDKISAGTPLTDADRLPWLASIVDAAADICESGQTVVVACSALRRLYRDQLRKCAYPVQFIFLRAPMDVIALRLERRKDHFAGPAIIKSQFETLEPPAKDETDITTVSVAKVPSVAMRQIMKKFAAGDEDEASSPVDPE